MLKKAKQVNAYIELLLRYNATHNLLKRNTKQEILDVVEELGDDLDTLKELFSVVKVFDKNIKDKSNAKEI